MVDVGDSKVVRIAQAAGLDVRRQGKDIVTLCPWHADSSPSLVLWAAKDGVHCLACGAKGGYVAFAQKLGVKLDDALGPLPTRSTPPPAVRGPAAAAPGTRHPSVGAATPNACEQPAASVDPSDFELPGLGWFGYQPDPDVRAYMEGRGLWNGAEFGVARFVTPNKPAVKWGHGHKLAFQLGFRFGAYMYKPGTWQPCGMQLRRLNDEKPKVIDHGAKGAFRSTQRRDDEKPVVLIVEGLTDFLALAPFGPRSPFGNAEWTDVIGIPGTASAGLLEGFAWRAGMRVLLAFDQDEAGDRATAQAMQILTSKGVHPGLITFEERRGGE